MLELNKIRAWPGAHRNTKRLGRGAGSGQGGTAGKGHKGQLARSGGHVRPGFEGGQTPMYRRMPKRGFTHVQKRSFAVLNLSDIERLGLTEVRLETLLKSNLIKGDYDKLAVLAVGELSRPVQVFAHRISASAKEKIQKAGGTAEVLGYTKLLKAPRVKKNKKSAKPAEKKD